MNKKTILETFSVISVLLALFVVWNRVAEAQRKKLPPSSNDISLAAFAREMPEPQRLVIAESTTGTTEFIWIGEMAWAALPSGPSCYVFDHSGTLVRWNISTNDAEPTTKDMLTAFEHPEISIDEAVAKMQ